MSNTTWTAAQGNTNWFYSSFIFGATNWNGGVPTISSTGSENITISGSIATQPVIDPTESGAPGTISVDQGGFTGTSALKEIQIDGELITLTSGANLTIQGVVIGNFHGTSGDTAAGGTISNITAANGTTTAYDTKMLISATGTDTLSINDITQNMGDISANGAGNKLNVNIFPGGNSQAYHTLINYGLMAGSNGGILNISTVAANGTTVSAFANDGWLLALGGTVETNAFISDDANVPNGAGTPDGYIEIGNSGTAMLLGGGAAKEEVLFLDGTSNILELANNDSFQGNIAGFGSNNTIQLAGVTGATSLSYSGSILTVNELNSAGAATATVTLNVGTGYSAGSFGALDSASGLDIISGNQTNTENFTFTGTGGNTNWYNASNWTNQNDPGSNIIAGENVTIEGAASIGSTPITDNGSIIVNGTTASLIDTSSLTGSGRIFIDDGGHVTLAPTTGPDTIPVTFGTHGTIGALNTLDINGTLANGASPYTGPITGFGLNDDIVIGPTTLPSVATGDQVSLSYTGSLLTVAELSSTGSIIGTTTLDVGTGYATNSFVALLGTNGINIETPQTVDEQGFTFQANGGSAPLGNFEDPTQYTGGLAPGSTIVAGETVTIVPTSLADLTTSLTNNGLILLDGTNANLDANAPLTGSGTIGVTGGGIFIVGSTGTDSDTVAFGAGANTLALGGTGPSSFTGPIIGENGNDTIILGNSVLPTPPSVADVGLSFNSATGVLTVTDTVNGSISTDQITFSGAIPGTFSAAVIPGAGIIITDIPCFAAGTRILTPDGDRRVEDLQIGSEVLTVTGHGDAVRKVVWAGHRTIDISRHIRPEKVAPVRILAGALGDGLPERELLLSPDHCLHIDGHLIEAKTLINGATIIQDFTTRTVTYHHIETEQHAIVLAEGVPAETYLESGNRTMFEGGAATVLHPDFAAQSRKNACAELVVNGPVVTAARQRLLSRALALGFTATDEVDMVVKAGLEKIQPAAESEPQKLLFVLNHPVARVDLLSSAGIPANHSANPDDRRRLGAAITAIALITDTQRHEISLDDADHAGFHTAEPQHCWTNGAAQVKLPEFTGRAVLEVRLNGQAPRWTTPQRAASVTA